MSQRFYNSHALLNMAVYLPAADENVIDGVRVAVGHWDTTQMGECRGCVRRPYGQHGLWSASSLCVWMTARGLLLG